MQKTAYELRISDWSSDVCSSDLIHFMLENPNRLVVDIHGVSMNQAIKQLVSKVKPNDPYIASIRVGQNRPHVVRLVLDLKQPIAPQIFTLKQVGKYKYRPVLGLYQKIAQDPLLALTKERAANNPHDSLPDQQTFS